MNRREVLAPSSVLEELPALDQPSPLTSLPPELFSMIRSHLQKPAAPRLQTRCGKIEYEKRFSTLSYLQYNDLVNLASTCKVANRNVELGRDNTSAYSRIGHRGKSQLELWLYEGVYGKVSVDDDVARFCKRVSAPFFRSIWQVFFWHRVLVNTGAGHLLKWISKQFS